MYRKTGRVWANTALSGSCRREPRNRGILADNGADIDLLGDGTMPLIIASCFPDQLDTVRLLVERGADVHAKDEDGKTALFYAQDYGIDDVASYLKEQGAE